MLMRCRRGAYASMYRSAEDSRYATLAVAARKIAMVLIESKLLVPSVFGRPPEQLVDVRFDAKSSGASTLHLHLSTLGCTSMSTVLTATNTSPR